MLRLKNRGWGNIYTICKQNNPSIFKNNLYTYTSIHVQPCVLATGQNMNRLVITTIKIH